jgi:hypothetical protein
MAKKTGSAAALPIMQQEAEAGNAIEEAELQPENPDAPIEVPQEGANAGAKPAEAAPAETPKPKPENVVPVERLQEVIRERNDLRERWARMDEKAKIAAQIQQQAQATAETARIQAQRPDPDVDPAGARIFDLEQKLAQQDQKFQQFQNTFQGTTQQFNEHQARLQLQQFENMDVQRAMAAHPDYMNALAHLRNTRITLNQRLGYTPEQAAALWETEKNAYVAQAMQNGVSATEFAYEMAKTVGYQPPQANGAAPANGATNGAARIQQLQNGQKVQGLGGKIPAADTEGYGNIDGMTAAQFDDWMNARWNEGGKFKEELMIQELNANPALRAKVNAKFNALG